MLHKVCLTVTHGECGLSEPPRKSHSFNSTRERWFGNLVECFAHCIISQASKRWIPASTLMMVVFIMQERLTRRSPCPGSITTILLIFRREVRIGRSSPSPLMKQLPLQMINLQLHGFSILLMRKVTPTWRLAPTSMGGMHISLSVPSSFKKGGNDLDVGTP